MTTPQGPQRQPERERPDAGGQYPYNPYPTTAAAPAGLEGGGTPATRPVAMTAALVLLVLSSLPFVALGAALLVVPINLDALPAGFDQQRLQAGITVPQVMTTIRIVGVVVLVIALLYVLFAVLAFLGRGWARVVVTVLTVIFGIILLLGLVGSGGDPASVIVVAAILVAIVAGTGAMYVEASSRFVAAARR